ncbi:MAG: LysM peptidoglycan-binding domain-containing protein [Anaerolineae bacterium]|nr:LysM peptidoglycan-binding domain-containing protein [Anaerolineae bacterium]
MRTTSLAALLLLSLLLLLPAAAQESTPETTPPVTAAPAATAEATAPVTAAPERTAEPTPPPGSTTYTVRAGETLFRIARRFGVSTPALAAANGITNINLIFAGQQLIIPPAGTTPPAPTATPTTAAPTATRPAATATSAPGTTPAPVTATVTPTPAPGTQTYTVVTGDTLFRIAVRFGTTVNALAQANNLSNPNRIFAGQRLIIPAPGTGSAPAGSSAPAIPGNVFARGIEVFIEGQDVNAIATQAVQLGVTWVKITVNWRRLEVTEGSPDFTQLDAAVAAFDRAGLNVMLTLTGAPDWARPSATDFVKSLTEQYGPPDDLADFATFAGAVATRYAGRVQAYEIWSEPNLRRNWIDAAARLVDVRNADGTTTQVPDAPLARARYIDLLRPAAAAIRTADPAAQIVSAGLAPTGLNDFYNAIADQVFLAALIDQGVVQLVDAIGAQVDGFGNPPDATCCNASPGVDNFFDRPNFYFPPDAAR